ncbi:protein maelstrom homolog isoform X2 [Culicoides brevitarsis]|uniref:protein maelstrom homolog isoform X2 n=1 Tax=Culicoides brevitarsis TaxID=469753 RepID=UPI00307BA09D
MPKKQPKNAYFFFMLEFKRHQEAMGRRFPGGMREVATAASEPWRSVSAREKQRFENMAKAHKEQDKKHGERYTSQGKSLSEVAREEEERKLREENKKKTIVKLIDDAVQDERLVDTPWYIMSFNYFTKEISHVKYYPAEVGITRFSIRKGITKKYHCLVNPGKLPLGHAFTAKDHGEKTHKLPVPPNALGESEFDTILVQILEFFTEERSSRDAAFPVFVNDPEMEMCESILRDFCEKSELEFDLVKVLPLTFFFQKLVAAVFKVYCDEESKFSFAIAQSHLERDAYDYHRGNGCQLHEVDDVNPHCALSRPTRWAYYIIDQTIGITGGRKRAGYHYPKGCIIDDDDNDSDSDASEDEKPETIISKTETRDIYGEGLMTDTERFTEISDIKVCKKEFSDDELTTTEVLTRGKRENDTLSTFSSKLEQVRRANNPRPRYDYETDTTLASRFEDERSYARQVNMNNTSRSTNPFHEDNFPSLGESFGKKVPNPLSYRQFDVDSDTSDQSEDRVKFAGNRFQRRRDDR